MKNFFVEADVAEILGRMDRLTPTSRAQWGKMTVGQAMAHCTVPMEMALGDRNPKRLLIGRLLGPIFRGKALDESPMSKNSPTDPTFVMTGERDLGVERERLAELIRRFHAGGPAGCTRQPHSFFGSLTPEQWARLQWKHVDHHLGQFGV